MQKLVVVEPSGQICVYRLLNSLRRAILPLPRHGNPDLSLTSGPAGVLSIVPMSCQLLPSPLSSCLTSLPRAPDHPQEECGSLSSQSLWLPEDRNKGRLQLLLPLGLMWAEAPEKAGGGVSGQGKECRVEREELRALWRSVGVAQSRPCVP